MQFIRFILISCLLLLTSMAGHASVIFSGEETAIAVREWQILDIDELPSPEQLAAGRYSDGWVPLLGATSAVGKARLVRLDLRVDYTGNQRPLLVIPYAFVPDLTIGLFRDGEVLLWKSLESESGMEQQRINRSTGMMPLPIDRPGDYQLLILGTSVANSVIVRGARLYLENDYLLRDYPYDISLGSGILGVLSTYILFCIAVLVFRFREDLVFAIIFLLGAFLTILLREGIIFLKLDLDVSWWIKHFLPTAIGMANAGILLYVSADLKNRRWLGVRRLLNVCGAVCLIVGIVNIFLLTREHTSIGALGLFAAIVGNIIALGAILVRAWAGSLRDRLYALFIGSFFVVTMFRFSAGLLSASVNVHITPLYLSFQMVGLYIFVEYLVTVTREIVDEKARKSAELTRTDLVNRFSHELRTPLNAVIGLADLMKGSDRPEKIDSYANMIQGAGHTLLGLVNDILDFSKLGTTGMSLVRQPLRLDRLMTDVVTGFLPRMLESRIVPHVILTPELPFYLLGDELRLKQIFTNLLNNGMKFSRPGGFVTVRIRKGVQLEGKIELLCSVTDTGRGIAAEKQAQIFEPYNQAEAQDGSQLRGTGLGLAICKLLIEQMGGEIRVDSVLGKGSTFSFNVWLDVDPNAPDLNACFAALRDKNVLMLTGLDSEMRVLPQCFEYWGARVQVVNHYKQAPDQHFDLIILETYSNKADGCDEWLSCQPVDTVIEVFETQSVPWVNALSHPNVHRVMVPVPLLDLVARFVEDLTGKKLSEFEEKPRQAQLVNQQHSVLLVDDNPVNLTVASKLLESLGVSSDCAQGGIEGLELLRSDKRYSLVLLDCEMPDINGFDVAQQRRTYEMLHDLPRLPIVALTAHALNEVKEQCLVAGMDEVLYKPIGRKAIIEMLNRYPGLS